MTIQIGMMGTDGVVIVGDTQWTHSPVLRTNEFWAGGRTYYNSSKIIISHERGIAISRARSMETATAVAQKIISDLKDDEFLYPISPVERIGNDVFATVERIERKDVQCLVVIIKPSRQLFLLTYGEINGQKGAGCQKMQGFAIVGDNVNSAIFWATKYYQKRPVDQLIPLAAHLVMTARGLNSATISGLEIVRCDESGIRRLSSDSIKELEDASNRWERSIENLFLNHQQQFSYASTLAD